MCTANSARSQFLAATPHFIADEVSTSPLELSRTAKSFDDFVSRSFSFAAGGNPFDCTGEVLAKPALLKDAMRAFIADNDFDYTMIAAPVFRSELATKIYPQIVEGIRDTESRVAVSAWTAGKLTDAGISIFRRADLPIFDHCGRAIRAIGTYDRWLRDRSTAVRLVFPNSALKRTDPFYAELRMELANAGILFGPASHFASLTDLGPSKYLFSASAGPYVFKLNCRTQLHKSTAGLVRFGIHDVPSLADAIDAMPCDLEHAGFMLEQQLRADVEVYVGGTTDPDFGKLIIAGFGGRFAEHLGGTALWLGDASPQDIQRWLGSSPLGKGLDVLDGTVLHELARFVHVALQWFMASRDVKAFDLNPVFINLSERSVRAVDCRIS